MGLEIRTNDIKSATDGFDTYNLHPCMICNEQVWVLDILDLCPENNDRLPYLSVCNLFPYTMKFEIGPGKFISATICSKHCYMRYVIKSADNVNNLLPLIN